MSGPGSYNFIICFPGDYYRMVFGDAASCGNAVYLELRKGSFFQRAVRLIARSSRVPGLLRLPFYRLHLRTFLRPLRRAAAGMADPEKPLCFILDRRYLSMLAKDMYEVLRREFPGSKTVVLYTDVISRQYYHDRILRSGQRPFADLIVTFDPREAAAYGIRFRNLPMTDLARQFLPAQEQWDVLFVGKGKDRLDKAAQVWNALTGRGLRCRFCLIGVPEKDRRRIPAGIECLDYMPYEEYLAMEAKSRILLELVQGGCAGNTLRVNEAVRLGKKLLSDNPYLKDNPVFDPANMFVFGDPAQIPGAFLAGGASPYPESVLRQLSLQEFLRSVEEDLSAAPEDRP